MVRRTSAPFSKSKPKTLVHLRWQSLAKSPLPPFDKGGKGGFPRGHRSNLPGPPLRKGGVKTFWIRFQTDPRVSLSFWERVRVRGQMFVRGERP